MPSFPADKLTDVLIIGTPEFRSISDMEMGMGSEKILTYRQGEGEGGLNVYGIGRKIINKTDVLNEMDKQQMCSQYLSEGSWHETFHFFFVLQS